MARIDRRKKNNGTLKNIKIFKIKPCVPSFPSYRHGFNFPRWSLVGSWIVSPYFALSVIDCVSCIAGFLTISHPVFSYAIHSFNIVVNTFLVEEKSGLFSVMVKSGLVSVIGNDYQCLICKYNYLPYSIYLHYHI